LSSEIASLTLFMRPPRSPRPRSLLIKPPASKGSRSSKCSPVPMKITGDSVAATAERAPPPLAWPSSFVMITEPTLIVLLKARAWS